MTANLKAIPKKDLSDGGLVLYSDKEVGRSDIFPQTIKHSPNGLHVMIGDAEEFIIYKIQGFKNVHFGQGNKFVWSNDNGFAVHRSDEVKLFDQNFVQLSSIKTSYQVDSLHGGTLLGIRSTDFVMFYEWETTTFIQKIEISCKDIIWNPTSNQLTITSTGNFYLLRYNAGRVKEALKANEVSEEGVDEAFAIDAEIPETVVSGIWLKRCFFFLTNQNKLNYVVQDKPLNFAYLERPSTVLGYMPTQGCLFFIDGANKITSFEVPIGFYSAISSIADEDFDGMRSELAKLENHKYYDRVAKYLESIGNLREAFEVVKHQELKFEYAIKLEEIEAAYEIACESGSKPSLKQIGDLCLTKGEFDKAENAFKLVEDFPSLLLMYSSLGRHKI